jgi:hypothetical protein
MVFYKILWLLSIMFVANTAWGQTIRSEILLKKGENINPFLSYFQILDTRKMLAEHEAETTRDDRDKNWRNLSPNQRKEFRKRHKRFEALPSEEKERIRKARQQFRELPPERREELRQQWRNMTPEERREKHRIRRDKNTNKSSHNSPRGAPDVKETQRA